MKMWGVFFIDDDELASLWPTDELAEDEADSFYIGTVYVKEVNMEVSDA